MDFYIGSYTRLGGPGVGICHLEGNQLSLQASDFLPNATYEFSYDIKKDQISIDYENESVRDGTYTFTVEDNTLTLIGGEGTVGGTYTLTRVEEE